MSGVTGRSMKMAFEKFGTNSWGVPASVTKAIYFEADGGMQFKPAQIVDNAFGQTFTAPSDSGLVEAPNLSLTGRMRYDDYSYLWDALAIGSPATVTLSTSATGQVTSWKHVFDLADNIDGLGLTTAIERVLYVEELTSAKVYGFEIAEDANGAMNVTYKVMGTKPTNISSVNVSATVSGAVSPALTNRIMQQHGVFRMNTFSAAGLASADTLAMESIKFTFERPQDAPHIYGQDYIAEPADNGFPVFSLELHYPRMNTVSANSLYAGLRNAQQFKADWTFNSNGTVGSNMINSTDAWQYLLQFPCLQMDTDGFQAPTAGAQQVKPIAKFMARLAPTSPTGMSFVRPFRLTRIMVDSVKAF